MPLPWLLDVLPCDVPGRLFLLRLVLSPYMQRTSQKVERKREAATYKSLVLVEWWPKGMLRSLMDCAICFEDTLLAHALLLLCCCCCCC